MLSRLGFMLVFSTHKEGSYLSLCFSIDLRSIL